MKKTFRLILGLSMIAVSTVSFMAFLFENQHLTNLQLFFQYWWLNLVFLAMIGIGAIIVINTEDEDGD